MTLKQTSMVHQKLEVNILKHRKPRRITTACVGSIQSMPLNWGPSFGSEAPSYVGLAELVVPIDA